MIGDIRRGAAELTDGETRVFFGGGGRQRAHTPEGTMGRQDPERLCSAMFMARNGESAVPHAARWQCQTPPGQQLSGAVVRGSGVRLVVLVMMMMSGRERRSGEREHEAEQNELLHGYEHDMLRCRRHR
jgi:hypothetical protein